MDHAVPAISVPTSWSTDRLFANATISATVSFILIGVGGVAIGPPGVAPVGIAVYVAISTVRSPAALITRVNLRESLEQLRRSCKAKKVSSLEADH
jgi:hypothetical protein